jgi:hypothetical protein
VGRVGELPIGTNARIVLALARMATPIAIRVILARGHTPRSIVAATNAIRVVVLQNVQTFAEEGYPGEQGQEGPGNELSTSQAHARSSAKRRGKA